MKVLVVDDARMMRAVISDLVTEAGDTVVGEAADGADAVRKARELRPDLVTLDVEMPGMNGIDALRQIMATAPTKVLLVSSVTTAGADVTLEGLGLGAIDFVPKPSALTSLDLFGTQLKGALRAARLARVRTADTPRPRPQRRPVGTGQLRKPQLIVVASSTGGPQALSDFLGAFAAPPPAPVLIVQHMPANFTTRLVGRLDRLTSFPVTEAFGGEQVRPGEVLLAAGGIHLGYRRGVTYADDSPPIGRLKPAADITFRDAAEVHGSGVLGVVLTGMGKDGLEGSKAIVEAGGQVIAQDGDSCVVDGMPRAVRDAELVFETGDPVHLAEFITHTTTRGVAA